MSSLDHIIVPSFAQLNLPPVEEYQKRKVALISGQSPSTNLNKKDSLTLFFFKVSLDRMVPTCERWSRAHTTLPLIQPR